MGQKNNFGSEKKIGVLAQAEQYFWFGYSQFDPLKVGPFIAPSTLLTWFSAIPHLHAVVVFHLEICLSVCMCVVFLFIAALTIVFWLPPHKTPQEQI